MKLKRILAGITACTIVGSTMLTMPVSARTTTKVENVSLSDLMNTAKMAADLKDDITPEKQAEILDKFDTNGNGQISIGELLAVAQRVARTNESDIVNEYGTADSEETTETTLETSETTETTEVTTETTEETTTTTEAIAFNPVILIDGTEYKDGDTFTAEANGVYEVDATDAENEITVSLTGSQDDDENNLVRVNGNKFEVIADGKLTITVKTADGQEKTITLNVITEKSLADVAKSSLYISYLYEGENYYSDDYKGFSNEIGKNIFNNEEIEDSEQYWEDKAQDFRHEKISGGTIYTGIGGKVEIKGFAIRNNNVSVIRGSASQYEDYNTSDKITYISTDTNKVTIDENGIITGIASTDGSVEIIVMVNGTEFSRFNVYVSSATYSVMETSDEKYAFDYYYDSMRYYQYTLLTEGKYVENASQGKALSLKNLQNQVGAENVKSVSVKNFDGTEINIEDTDITDENGVMYYADTTTSTVYYAITSETGEGSFKVNVGNGMIVTVKVLDMEQYKNYQTTLPESLIFEFRDRKVVATAENTTANAGIYYLTEGETFSLSDIVKVNGVDDPKITVTNSQDGKPTQNLDYNPLTKTFTARELTEENSGYIYDTIDLNYTASDGTTRKIVFVINVCRPIVPFNPSYFGYTDNYSSDYVDMNGGKIYITKKMLPNSVNFINDMRGKFISFADDINGLYPKNNMYGRAYIKYTVDNEKMFKLTEYGIIFADGYNYVTSKAGDTATITITDKENPNIKVSFTIEVVDELPKAVINGAGTDTFTYPAKNKSNQTITFTDIVDVNNLPDDCTLVPYIEDASGNVEYIDADGNKVNASGTVNASGIKIIRNDKHYSITGIDVASASKVGTDTSMSVRVKVLDGKGNTITVSDPIELSVKGENSAANDSLSMTINGITKEIGTQTADFGTIYVKENGTTTYSTNGTGKYATITPDIINGNEALTIANGSITANKLTVSNSETNGQTVTFKFGNNRKATAKIVIVRPVSYAPAYVGEGYIDVTGIVYYVDDEGKDVAKPAFATKVNKDNEPVLTDGLVTKDFNEKNRQEYINNIFTTYTLQGIDIEVKEEKAGKRPRVLTDIPAYIYFDEDASSITIGKSDVIKNWSTGDVVISDTMGIFEWRPKIDSECNITLTKPSHYSEENKDFEREYLISIRDRNKNILCKDVKKVVARIKPTIEVTQIANENNSKFTYKFNEEALRGWTVTNIDVLSSYVKSSPKYNSADKTFSFETNNVSEFPLEYTLEKDGVTYSQKSYLKMDITTAPTIAGNLTHVNSDEPDGYIYEYKLDVPEGWTAEEAIAKNYSGVMDYKYDKATQTLKAKNTVSKITAKLKKNDANIVFETTAEIRTTVWERKVSLVREQNKENKEFIYEINSDIVGSWVVDSVTSDDTEATVEYDKTTGKVTIKYSDAISANKKVSLKITGKGQHYPGTAMTQTIEHTVIYNEEPKVSIRQENNTDNKAFEFYVDIPSAWDIESAVALDSDDCEIAIDKNKDILTFTYKNTVETAEKTQKVKITFKCDNYGEVYITKEFDIPVNIVDTSNLVKLNSIDAEEKKFDYYITLPTGFDKVDNVTVEGYAVKWPDINDKWFTVDFSTGFSSEKPTVEVICSKKNSGEKITMTVELDVPIINMPEDILVLTGNTDNKEFKYGIKSFDDWEISWTKELYTEDFTELTTEGTITLTKKDGAVAENTDAEMLVRFRSESLGVDYYKKVKADIPKKDFPELAFENTEVTSNDNMTFVYQISNLDDFDGWNISAKAARPNGFSINYDDNGKITAKRASSTIISDTDVTIRCKITKTEYGVTYTSEQDITLTAKYTDLTANNADPEPGDEP